jgi:3'(2'), 5'-bisphosphate nucleotidase
MELEKELNVALNLVKKAGDILIKNLGETNFEIKEDGSPVTKIDYEVSNFFQKELKKAFPNYGILDEENKIDGRQENDFCWVVDPLDGTQSYIRGDLNFGILLGLMYKFKPVLGVAYRPALGGLIYSVEGGETFCNGNKLNVKNSSKNKVLISLDRENGFFSFLQDSMKMEVTKMPTSFKISEVAKGNYDLFLCPPKITMNLWDLCAQEVILKGAGGMMTDFFGNPINYAGDVVNRFGVIASNSHNHFKIGKKIREKYNVGERNLLYN